MHFDCKIGSALAPLLFVPKNSVFTYDQMSTCFFALSYFRDSPYNCCVVICKYSLNFWDILWADLHEARDAV